VEVLGHGVEAEEAAALVSVDDAQLHILAQLLLEAAHKEVKGVYLGGVACNCVK
jgi:hypothetical protein